MATVDKRAQLQALIGELQTQRIGRREFLRRAGVLGLSASAIGYLVTGRSALAQDATPAASPAVAGEVVRSVTREEYAQSLFAAFPQEEAAQTGGEIIIGENPDLETLNPLLVSSSPTGDVISLVFETLVGVSPVDGSIVPGLAESYEIAADGVTYTFTLDANALFHDGTPVTAEDVKFSFDTILNPGLNSQYQPQVSEAVASYRVVDERTFEVISKQKLFTFFYDALGPIYIIPRHIWQDVAPSDFGADPGSTGEDPSRVIGTGPFKFESREIGVSSRFVKNPDYYDTVSGRVPTIDAFTFQVLPDDNAAVQALIVGDTDILIGVPAPQTQDVIDADGADVQIYDTLSFTYYAYQLNPEITPLFQQREVRQALFIALDKDAIIETIYAGFGTVARGTQSTLSIAYAPDRIDTTYDFDPQRARDLLAQAGWEDTDGDGVVEREGQALAFRLMIPEGANAEAFASYFQEAWGEVGAEVTPEIIPFDVMVGENGPLDARDFDTFLLGFNWDPDAGQGAMFKTTGGFNYSGYSNPEWDRLEDQQLQEFDAEARREILIQQANIVNEDLPVGIFRFVVGRDGFRDDRLHNYTSNFIGELWSLPFVWVEQS